MISGKNRRNAQCDDKDCKNYQYWIFCNDDFFVGVAIDEIETD